MKESTFVAYAQRFKREGWGKNGIGYGPKGYSNYIYMNQDKDINNRKIGLARSYPKKETQLVHNAVRIKQGKYNF